MYVALRSIPWQVVYNIKGLWNSYFALVWKFIHHQRGISYYILNEMNVLLALRGMMNHKAYPSNSEFHDFLCLPQNF